MKHTITVDLYSFQKQGDTGTELELILQLDWDNILNQISGDLVNEKSEVEFSQVSAGTAVPTGTSWKINSTFNNEGIYNVIISTMSRKKLKKEKINKENKNKERSVSAAVEDKFTVCKKADKYRENLRKGFGNGLEVESWTANQFMHYIRKRFKETYNTDSFEFNMLDNPKTSRNATGKLWAVIKRNLIDKFENSGLTKVDLKDYIDWAYEVKAAQPSFNITISLSFLCSSGLIIEWDVKKKAGKIGKSNGKDAIKVTYKKTQKV
jgi:hypothetical protein